MYYVMSFYCKLKTKTKTVIAKQSSKKKTKQHQTKEEGRKRENGRITSARPTNNLKTAQLLFDLWCYFHCTCLLHNSDKYKNQA